MIATIKYEAHRESLLGAHAILFVLSRCSSYVTYITSAGNTHSGTEPFAMVVILSTVVTIGWKQTLKKCRIMNISRQFAIPENCATQPRLALVIFNTN